MDDWMPVPSSEQSRHLMLSVAACSGRSCARFDSGAFSRVLMPVCSGREWVGGEGVDQSVSIGRSCVPGHGHTLTGASRSVSVPNRKQRLSPTTQRTFSNASNSAFGRGRAIMLRSALLHFRQSMPHAARTPPRAPHKCASL